MKPIIGVLALQGDFKEHCNILAGLQVEAAEVRTINDLKPVHGLIIPGGESTTIGKLLKQTKLDQAIIDRVTNGMPAYGTCAGAIILAQNITGQQKADNLKLIDIEIQRNAYGRQLDSFITDLEIDPKISPQRIKAVFIRAPIITKVGPKTEILASFNDQPVIVQENNLLVSTFHPELTQDAAIHQYFLKMVAAK